MNPAQKKQKICGKVSPTIKWEMASAFSPVSRLQILRNQTLNPNIHPCVMVAGSVVRKLASSGDIVTPSHGSRSGVSARREIVARGRRIDGKSGVNEAVGESVEGKGNPGSILCNLYRVGRILKRPDCFV